MFKLFTVKNDNDRISFLVPFNFCDNSHLQTDLRFCHVTFTHSFFHSIVLKYSSIEKC